MKIDVSTRHLSDRGGLELATLRMAQLLQERGHDVRLLFGSGAPVAEFEVEYVPLPALAGDNGAEAYRSLATEFARGARDVHITSCADEAVLRVSKKIVPTITYSMEHSAICPAGSKYWSTLQRACHVRAGAICTLARPILGCGQPRTSFTQEPLRRRQSYAAELASPASRIWVPSTDLRRRFLHQGFDAEAVAVMANLGIRKSAEELQEAAERTPPQLRDRVLFIGRLSKEKGVRLLPRLGADGDLTERLLCIGDGYLREWLAPQLGERLLSSIDQAGISGVLMWARGLLFPSLWPEPGGIVGIDAQLFGVPVAAFGVGAPLDWPNAKLLPPGDTAAMVEWASTLARPEPRDTTAVAEAQQAYWRDVGERAEILLCEFVGGRVWSGDADDPVRKALGH